MKRYIGWVLVGLLMLVGGGVFAQDNTSWISNFLPTGDDPAAVSKWLQQGERSLVADDLLLVNRFDFDDSWETYNAADTYLRVVDGTYHLYQSNTSSVMWGQNTETYADVAIEVRTRQLSSEENNGYGIMCRTSLERTTYEGYDFWISGDGYYATSRVDPDSVTDFTEWTSSDLINQGMDAENHLLAVCYEDYFAFYINGTLVDEFSDDVMREGAVSMAAMIYEEGADVHIAFDDLRVWSLTEAPATVDTDDATDETSESGAVVQNNADTPPTPEATTRPNSVRGLLNIDDEDDADVTSDAENATVTAADADIIPALADERIALGELLFEDDFSTDDAWVGYENDEGDATRVRDGALWMHSERGDGYILWSLNGELHRDAVVQAQATYLDGTINNGYGLICRGHPSYDSSGYYFMMADTGYAKILKSVDGEFEDVTDWERTQAIRVADSNLLTAVCIGEDLLFFINGDLVAQGSDDAYTAGYSGAAASHYDDSGVSVDVTFDELAVWEASFTDEE